MNKYTYQSSKTPSLLKDNSWIRKPDEEDENVDQDPNFGKSVLSQYRSNENLESSEPEETKTTKTISTRSSVQALSKRFSGSQDELKNSTLPSSKTSTNTKSSYSLLKSPTTTSTTTVTKDGTTTETTITTSQTVRSPVIKSPTKTETFTERVLKTSSKEPVYSPIRTTKVTEKTVTTDKDAENKLLGTLTPSTIKDDRSPTSSKTTVHTTETVTVKSSTDTDAQDKLYNTLIPLSIKGDSSASDSKTTISSTETVTVRSSTNGDGIKTTTTTRTSTAEDDLYGTLLPKSITSPVSGSTSIKKREVVTVDSSRGGDSPNLSSPVSTHKTSSYSSYTESIPSTRTTSYSVSTLPSDNYSSDRRSYYSKPDSSYEYSSITSPSTYSSTSYRSSSRSDDVLSDTTYSKSSSLYSSPERTVHEKDLCTYCHKPFTGNAKMILDDKKINCHASCFKCEVCNSSLGNMKAGDSLWIYRNMVHCENCFEVTKEKWRR